MHRRDMIKAAIAGPAVMGAMAAGGAEAAKKAPDVNDRAYMAGLLQTMAEPVLSNMAAGNLKKNFALEVSPTWDGRNKGVAYMEAFARLMAGVAPWLSLPEDDTTEGRVRKRLEQQALQSFVHSVDPHSPDYLLWQGEGQALVDSAYFTNALMRAPKQLWEPLPATTKKRIVEEIKGLRRVS
ncbi:MAG: hypothetical protein B7Z26_05030, partial [Asticcacaulis sp. 32-58-5]